MKTLTFLLLALLIPLNSIAKNAKWTILVYMNADNNLERDGIDDFLEMSAVPNSEEINILVQFDRAPLYSDDFGNWTQTLRFKIRYDLTPLKKDALMDLGEQNMGDPRVFKDFISWGKSNYPADHYMVIFWGHGQGYRSRNVNFEENELMQAYVDEYNQSQRLTHIAKQTELNKLKQSYASTIVDLTNQENQTVQDLEFLLKDSKLFPPEFKTSVKSKSSYTALFIDYKNIVGKKISKLNPVDLKLINNASSLMEKLITIDYNQKDIQASFDYIDNEKVDDLLVTTSTAATYKIKNDPVKSCSTDETDKDYLFNKEIQDALNNNEAEIIGFDTCLMSMLETGYILKGKCSFLLGSEEEEPGSGWNYTLWLNDLIKNPDISPLYLSKSVVNSYERTYQYLSATLSCMDLSVIQNLLEQLEIISKGFINKLATEAANFKLARQNCLKYARTVPEISSIDLSLFLYHFAKLTNDFQLKQDCEKARSIISLLVVSNFSSPDHAFKESIPSYGSLGIAIYFPSDRSLVDAAYSDKNSYYPIQFVKDYSWDNFLEKYLAIKP